MDLFFAPGKGRRFDRFANSFGDHSGLFFITAGQKYNEFIPAVPCRQIARTDRGGQQLTGKGDHVIAHGVTEAVVHGLEVVDIDDDAGQIGRSQFGLLENI